MAEIIMLDDIDTEKMFVTKTYMLGDKAGKYFVVHEEMYLGRYKTKEDAQLHVNALNNPSKLRDDRSLDLILAEIEVFLKKEKE